MDGFADKVADDLSRAGFVVIFTKQEIEEFNPEGECTTKAVISIKLTMFVHQLTLVKHQ